MSNFGDRIKVFRKKLGLNQDVVEEFKKELERKQDKIQGE